MAVVRLFHSFVGIYLRHPPSPLVTKIVVWDRDLVSAGLGAAEVARSIWLMGEIMVVCCRRYALMIRYRKSEERFFIGSDFSWVSRAFP
jgi:hypothetical protein